MNEEKPRSSSGEHASNTGEGEQKPRGSNASRARNQTVMLTPEITGHVRSLLAKEGEGTDPISDLLPPVQWERAQPLSRTSSAEPSPLPGGAELFDSRATGKQSIDTSSLEGKDNRQGASFSVNFPGSGGQRGISSSTLSGGSGVGVSHKVVTKAPRSKIVGFLISFDVDPNGEVYEIRAGRWLITSRPTDHGDYILIADESISPLHAIMRATKEGKIQVLDQLSEFGSSIKRISEDEEQDIAGAMVNVGHGDQLRFGKRLFMVCFVPSTTESREDSQ